MAIIEMQDLAVGPSPVHGILYAGRLLKTELGEQFVATSLPGHLLHYVLKGGVVQQCNGRTYELQAGSVLWYHEDEWVTGTVSKVPWEFYSIHFIAPAYPPPPFESRYFSAPAPGVESLFAEIVTLWEKPTDQPTRRLIQMHGRLLQILEHLSVPQLPAALQQPIANLWWDLETRLRQDLSQPVSLSLLEEWAGCSAATIARSAQLAVGQSPMRRIKEIRLSLARGLVQRSDLTLGQIAARIGYTRLHEFSRDYRKYFGIPPRTDRTTD